MLLVQEYLRTHSFLDLAREHGVYTSFSKSGHKFSLNYDQLEARESNPLAQECRGLILAAVDGRSFLSQSVEVDNRRIYDAIVPGETRILAFPMMRFFNHGQDAAAKINWSDSNLAFLEKLDGTLTILYFDCFTKKWCVATRSVPEADIVLDSGFYTFRSLFEKAIKDTIGMSFDDFTSNLDKEITYCFELTSPYNRIVLDYKETRITLIAARFVGNGMETVVDGKQCASLYELDIDKINTYGIPHVHAYKFACLNNLLDWVSRQNPLEHEGIVVRDSKFNRVKVKNASYVAFNKVRNILGTSERSCLELILAEKEDDVITALPPEIIDRIVNIKRNVQFLIKNYDHAYKILKSTADQINPGDKKTFALLVKDHKDIWPAPMFSMFDQKSSDMKDFILKNKKGGTWGDSFLDKILSISKMVDIY